MTVREDDRRDVLPIERETVLSLLVDLDTPVEQREREVSGPTG